MSMIVSNTNDGADLDGAAVVLDEQIPADPSAEHGGAPESAEREADETAPDAEPAEDDRIIYLRIDVLDHDPEFNVRPATAKFPADDDDRRLIDSIDKEGLIESLLVRRSPDDPDRWMVPAGERRRRSLGVIAGRKRGRYKPHSMVPCLVREKRAMSASFDENTCRKAMHPADWLRACQRLIDAEGLSVAGLAKRLRQTEADIRKHLALANLHPAVMEAFAADVIGIDAARAYAGSSDPARQLNVFERLSEAGHAGVSHMVRSALSESAVRLNSGLMKFVGLKGYEKAGGRVEVDLFGNDSDARAIDVDLLNELADKKLGKARDKHAEGWAWAKAIRPDGVSFVHDCARMPVRVDVPEDVAQALREAEDEAERLNEALWVAEDDAAEAEGDPEAEAEHAAKLAEAKQAAKAADERVAGLEATITRAYTSVPDELRALAGIVVSFDRWDGELEVHAGLISPEDAHALDEWHRSEGATGGPSADAFGGRDGAAPVSGPSSFARDLGRARRQATRAALADESETALLLVQFETCLHHFHLGYVQRALEGVVSACQGGEPDELEHMEGTRHLAERRKAFDTSWIVEDGNRYSVDRDASAEAFARIDAAERARMFAYCVAVGLTGGDPTNTGAVLPALFAERIGTDVARWWRPTRTAYFDRLKKDELIETGVQWYGETFRTRHAKSKRQPLRDALARVFEADESELTEAERAIRSTWIPASMA